MIYVSTGAFVSQDLGAIVTQARDIGLRGVELASGLRLDGTALERLAEHELAWLVHNYVPAPRIPFALNLASGSPETAERSQSLAMNAVHLAASLGAPFYSVHSGFVAELRADDLGHADAAADRLAVSEVDRAAALQRFEAAVLPLADEAAELGIDLLIENNVAETARVAPALLNVTAADTLACLERIDHPRVGVLFDVGHAKVSAHALGLDPEEMLEELAPHIRCLHLSDNDGVRDTNATFDETAWFWPHLERFSHLPWVIEAYRLEPDALRLQVERLERAFGAMHG